MKDRRGRKGMEEGILQQRRSFYLSAGASLDNGFDEREEKGGFRDEEEDDGDGDGDGGDLFAGCGFDTCLNSLSQGKVERGFFFGFARGF